MFHRLKTLILKEMQSFVNSPQGKQILIMPVIIQTIIFPFAATLEIKNASIVIFNQDNGAASAEMLQRISAISAISKIYSVSSHQEMAYHLENQNAILGIKIDNQFSSKITQKQIATIQVLLDGRKSNSAQILYSYINKVIVQYALSETEASSIQAVAVTNFFNPNLEFLWHLMPSLIAMIASIGCLMVTGLSLSREKEEGTFDQLIISPLPAWAIMFGKLMPGLLISLFQGVLVLLFSIIFYNIPFTGSILVLIVGFIFFGLSVVGIGLFISSLCSTQQQAFLGVFSALSPMILLSGYLSPIENMPVILQLIAYLNPLTHFIILVKGIMLRSYGWTESLEPMLALIIFTILSLFTTYKIFLQYKSD